MLPLLITVTDTEARTEHRYAFVRGPVRIGRNAFAELGMRHAAVSDWHARVEFDDATTQVTDLGSSNGTRLRGAPLASLTRVALDDGATLEIGPLHLRVERANPPAGWVTVPDAPSRVRDDDDPDRPATRTALAAPRVVASRAYQAVAWSPHPPRDVATQATPVALPTPRAAPLAQPARPSGPAASAQSAPVIDGPRVPAPVSRPSAPGSSPRDALAALAQSVQTLDERIRGADRAAMSAASLAADVESGVRDLLAAQPPGGHRALLDYLSQRLPDLDRFAWFRDLVASDGAQIADGASPPAMAESAWLDPLAEHLGLPPPQTSAARADLVRRLVAVSTLFADGWVAHRDGEDALASDLALPVRSGRLGRTHLQSLRDGRAVLAYLLDPAIPGVAGLEEAASVLADGMADQVARHHAWKRVVQTLLQRLDPATIDTAAQAAPRGVFARWIGRWRVVRAATNWAAYLALHRGMVESDAALLAALPTGPRTPTP